MKTYLPYFMRKVGIAIFLIGFAVSMPAEIDDMLMGFEEGYSSARYDYEKVSYKDARAKRISENKMIVPLQKQEKASFYGFLISLTGIITYVFSKEKIEDEFAAHLRGKSMLISVGITWLIFLLLKIPDWKTEIGALSILQVQMLVFIIVYAYQRKWKHWA